MTKFQKQMLTIAAAGALTAVTALPAMAFENEFHGLFQFKTFFSNYDKGSSATVAPTTLRAKAAMNNYMDQRTRIQYIAKASDDLKLVTHFEMNTRWGGAVNQATTQSATTASTTLDYNGGDLDTDGLNVLTKHAYLDFNIGKSFNTKVGLQAYKDALKGVFIDADVPAILTTTKMGNYTLGLGFSRFNDMVGTTGVTRLGDLNTDLFIMDNSYALSKDTKVGLSYYWLADYKTANADRQVHTLGLTGETKVGPLSLSGFAAMQAGFDRNEIAAGKNQYYHGYAFNAAAKMNVGTGAARVTGLFLSGKNGNTNAQNGAWQMAGSTSGVGSYNEGMTMLLVRNTALGGTSTDNFMYGKDALSNVALATVGYDANFTEKLFLNSTAAFAWSPKSFGAPQNNASDFVGTEINTELGYKLYKNLTLKGQLAYVILGGYYHNASSNDATKAPDNPYTMRIQAAYTF